VEKQKEKMKTVLITGANSGIGLATTKLFVNQGYFVFGHYHKSCDNLDALHSDNLKMFRSDFQNLGEVSSLFHECISAKRRVDILVNNAADYTSFKSILSVTSNEFERILRVNLIAPFILCQMAFESMKKNMGGRIINISSIGVKFGGAQTNMPYSASKAALESMTRTYAKAGAPFNILVNTVRAGVTNTDLHHKNPGKNMNERIKLIPMKRMADPEEIANSILFLASEKSSYTTGSILTVAGGE